MLKINTTQPKELTFEVQIGGVVDYDQVTSFFRIVIEDIEYGFPCKVMRDSIKVTLPPLNKVIGKRIKEGDEANIKLEVIADGHFLAPWQDRAKLSNPLVIEAKIKDTSFVKKPILETKLISEDGGAKQTAILEEKEIDLSEDLVNKLIPKLRELMKIKEQDEKSELSDDSDESEEKEIEEKCKPKTEQRKTVSKKSIERVLTDTINKLNLAENSSTKEKKKKKVLTVEEFKRNLTKEDVYKYMTNSGTKNAKIQDIIYEQACALAKTSKPVDILKQVIKVMKKK
jgi:hypothetical protein